MLIFVHRHFYDEYSGIIINIKEGEFVPYSSYVTFIVNYRDCNKCLTEDIRYLEDYRIFGNTYRTGEEYKYTNTECIPIENLMNIRDKLIAYQDTEDDWIYYKDLDDIKKHEHYKDCIRIFRDDGSYWDAFNTMDQLPNEMKRKPSKRQLKDMKREAYFKWKIPNDKEIYDICKYLFSILDFFDYDEEAEKFRQNIAKEINQRRVDSVMESDAEKNIDPSKIEDYEARREYQYFRRILNQN